VKNNKKSVLEKKKCFEKKENLLAPVVMNDFFCGSSFFPIVFSGTQLSKTNSNSVTLFFVI
jgi:hypothetical protein